jgi:hypothetical protein
MRSGKRVQQKWEPVLRPTAPLYERAHDLIAKPPTLWRIMRLPFAGLLGRS